ncbi:FadR/GntR family transcriptional regulator [Nocardia miyunensis]|uniref:FadR/GntR family transcriptional regulator n=1 Tax=Nocardia miyunensis TaxID=282684 RepID=UPI0008321746|nr:FCD domain-containing protein [Nocardia miyunensis]
MPEPVGLGASVLQHVDALIAQEGLGPGDKLPTERELAAAIGVSRAVVRSALNGLESRGAVIRHVGRGTFLAPNASVGVRTESENQPSPAEIMSSRLTLEPELLPLAVAAATQADIAEMRRCLQGGEKANSSEEFEHWDTALHHSFALATHNMVLIRVSELLIESRRQPVWGGLKKRTFRPELQHEYCTEHSEIVEAIADRDPDAARAAMRAHLRHVRNTLLGDQT